jgi:hypothetical protein
MKKDMQCALTTTLLGCCFFSFLFTAACGHRKHKGTIGCGLLQDFSLPQLQA